jgi:hypothetical protein
MRNGALNKPYYVVLDANVWVAERLLQSTIGSAVLYALTSTGALLELPETVEMEVNSVLTAEAERAVEGLRKSARLLRQLSGQKTLHQAPTAESIQEGIKKRWAELSGLLEKTPFSFELAKSALIRVIEKRPPSGENNEQFRDSCLWEAALERSKEGTVHLVTNDGAFYESRDRTRGLEKRLCEETAATGRDILIYSSIREFLSKMDKTVAVPDESTIKGEIVEAVAPDARRVAAENAQKYVLASSYGSRISGYATPKPSVVAISFEVWFKLKRTNSSEKSEPDKDGSVRIEGVCSYDPKRTIISDVEVREWTVSIEDRGMSQTHTNLSDLSQKTRYIE